MRPVNRGEKIKLGNNQTKEYSDYIRARRDLINRLGEYCSYCESRLTASIAVEHIQPKSKHEGLEVDWNNFLLACVNCNSTKGDKDVTLEDYIWPHRHNTFWALDYKSSGQVMANPQLSKEHRRKTQNLIDLVGLSVPSPNKGTVKYEEASDRRWEHRIKQFIDAEEKAMLYKQAPPETRKRLLPFLKTIVIGTGNWSIWMLAFQDFPEILTLFIQALPHTESAYFDINTGKCLPHLSIT